MKPTITQWSIDLQEELQASIVLAKRLEHAGKLLNEAYASQQEKGSTA